MLRCKSMALLFLAFLLCGVYSPLFAQEKQKPKPLHAPNALPGVEQEMLAPDYWIALQPDADKVIMTPAEIEKFNEKNRARKIVFRDLDTPAAPVLAAITLEE